ncbi:unnamed protein product [Merluccius merluccius]
MGRFIAGRISNNGGATDLGQAHRGGGAAAARWRRRGGGGARRAAAAAAAHFIKNRPADHSAEINTAAQLLQHNTLNTPPELTPC